MLDEIFMWRKKPSLLKFHKKVAAAPLAETFGYFKPEVLAGEPMSFRRGSFSP